VTGRALLVSTVGLVTSTVSLVFAARRDDQQRRDTERSSYVVYFPRGVAADDVVAVVRALSSLRTWQGSLLGRDSVAFELVGRQDEIAHHLRLPRHRADFLLGHLRTLIPGISAVAAPTPRVSRHAIARELRLVGQGSIRSDQPAALTASMLSALQNLRAGELVLWQWVVHPIPQRSETAGGRDKEPLFAVAGRVAVQSAAAGRSGQLVAQLLGVLRQVEQPRAALVRRRIPSAMVRARMHAAATPFLNIPARLDARSVAALAGWTTGELAIPGLRLTGSRPLAPSKDVPGTGLVFGRANHPSYADRLVAVPQESVILHGLVTGPTGSGKSTLLLNLIKQTVDRGDGCVIIDPGSGELAADALELVPRHRQYHVVLLEAHEAQMPVGLNLFASARVTPELAADQVLTLIRAANRASWGPRLDYVLYAALVALAATGFTLVELPALLLNRSFRQSVVSRLDPSLGVQSVFTWFDSMSDAARGEVVPAVLNKVAPILRRRSLRAMIGQNDPRWSMREVLDESRILIVSLPTGLVGPEAARLLGSAVVALLWQAVEERSGQSRERRRPVLVFADEVSRLVHAETNLSDALRRARSHGVGFFGAVQHLSALPPTLRSTFLSEARTKLAFQPGADDAQELARHFGPTVTGADLLTLPLRTVLAHVPVAGGVSTPFTATTLPPPSASGHGSVIRAISREQYGRDRNEVEETIARRVQTPSEPEGRLRRRRT
jgi:Type IV secretion-system coupling protein DNA-binding domain